MFTNTQDADKEISAGLYLRARRQIRSWTLSWPRGQKKFTNVADAEPERTWSGLAEWLRVAHSMLDEKAVELARNGDRSSQVRAME